ncbi:NACHT domain-containing protein [Sphingomonas psychrotolerans]|uniref:NACHT domain-containing protein n=1 Tax=Sphingomonas psychrotolerans TaxID=1327635 RepID=A0ABU3N4P8_9SPHN|nr:NACHT domain-containing protein [Sphingomonas psychrotolerans]MDT8758747.1 NACHT domain-containing protein [Sphingomonas psychrotolerans]
MGRGNTTARGNTFRDAVERVLGAAGFITAPETRVGHKNVDVAGFWTRDEMAGEQRYAFEAKDFSGTLPTAECSEFASDHLPLLLDGTIDRAWLISKGPIAPAGRSIRERHRGLQAMTFSELQRRLLLIDSYLKDLVEQHETSQLDRFYIRPETTKSTDLQQVVEEWVAADGAAPMFVLGGYGKGKSTFASHLAAEMAKKALADPTARAPILVRLGEIADEQSIEGLLGKVLASQHRVTNYHFETFRALNRNGRFLIIYDGFDEMKHGLTPSKFQLVLTELMRLDEGDARILVLGRDTAFHDDVEFRAIIGGIQRTGAGREIKAAGRRAYRHVEIRGFTPDEARTFVANYLPVRALREQEGPATNEAWIAQRVAELSSGRFDRLLERPVHAQMLCEIAVQPDQLSPDMSVYELFDSFVHYLIARELEKKGRDPSFPLAARRRFNSHLAWWLWEMGGASTTTLNDIPQSICEASTRGLNHTLDREETRRELIQGCLVEKGINTIYFHRSLQEFLAAEHLIETDLLFRTSRAHWLRDVTAAVNPEIIKFVVAGANVSRERRDRALLWLSNLTEAGGDHNVVLPGFDLFIELGRSLDLAISNPFESPWLLWLSFFMRTGARDFTHRGANTFPVLADLLVGARDASSEAQAAALYALCRTLFHPVDVGARSSFAIALAAMIPVRRLADAVDEARAKKSEKQIVRRNDEFMLWTLLRSWEIEQDPDGTLVLTVNLAKLHNDAMGVLPHGFSEPTDSYRDAISVPVQALYRALAALRPKVSEQQIDQIRPFFNDPKIRKSIVPVQIERKKAVITYTDLSAREERPKLSIRERRKEE